MTYRAILLERKNNIGILKLNRPKQRNALSAELTDDIIAGLQELDSAPDVHVIVIMSNVPGVFCAGRDLTEASATPTNDIIEQRKISNRVAKLWLTMRSIRKVTIGMVNGFALAAGTGMAACCDIVIASEDAVFGLPEINVGLWPTTVGPAMAHSIIGIKKYFERCVTGYRFNAVEAEKMGLVNKVVPADKLEEESMALAQEVASKSPTTLQIGKQAFYDMLDMEYAKAVSYAAELLTIIANSHDGREGQAAFVEKRMPQWQKLK